MSKPVFSLVIPVYQNAPNLERTFHALRQLETLLPEYALELIFVDDGSTDGSFARLEQFHRDHPRLVKVVKFTRNFGQTYAIQAGLRAATGACHGIISADLQDPPELFVEMIRHWEKGEKLVLAERADREDRGPGRWLSSLYWRILESYGLKGYPKGGADCFLLDREVSEKVARINERNTMIFALIFWLGYDFVTIPYTRRKREAGVSQWSFVKKLKLFVDTLIAFTYLPSRAIVYLGLTFSVLSMSYAGVMVANWYYYKQAPPGWATIAVSVLGLGSLNLLCLGIISEYLLRILDEARKRPTYVIDRVLSPPPGTTSDPS